MNRLLRSVASAFLMTLPAMAQANGSIDLQLAYDRGEHRLLLTSAIEADVVLVVGRRANPPIAVAGIEVAVLPELIAYLGHFGGGQAIGFDVPLGMVGIAAQAIALPAGSLQLVASDAVGFGDDLVTATFDAELRVDLSLPPRYSVATSLVAPTSGFVYVLDLVERSGDVINVYLTLEAPSITEPVLLVLTAHEQVVDLGTDVGHRVDVYLRRTERGTIGHEVYERLVQLRL